MYPACVRKIDHDDNSGELGGYEPIIRPNKPTTMGQYFFTLGDRGAKLTGSRGKLSSLIRSDKSARRAPVKKGISARRSPQ